MKDKKDFHYLKSEWNKVMDSVLTSNIPKDLNDKEIEKEKVFHANISAQFFQYNYWSSWIEFSSNAQPLWLHTTG